MTCCSLDLGKNVRKGIKLKAKCENYETIRCFKAEFHQYSNEKNESTSEDKLDTEVKKDMILNNPYN